MLCYPSSYEISRESFFVGHLHSLLSFSMQMAVPLFVRIQPKNDRMLCQMELNKAKMTHVFGFASWKLAVLWQVLHWDRNLSQRETLMRRYWTNAWIEDQSFIKGITDTSVSRNERTWSWLMVTVTAKTRLYRLVSRNWRSAAMACCQHNIQQRPPERILPLMGWTAASRCQLVLAKNCMWGKGKREDPPRICERGWDGNTNRGEYPSMCQVGINVRMSWQALRSLPSHPSSCTNTLLPCFEHMVHQQRHLAALTPGSCASSSPVGSLGTATSSTTCGSSRVKRRAMNYFAAAAANLTFIQEFHCTHTTATHMIMLGWQHGFYSAQRDSFVRMWWHGSTETKDEGLTLFSMCYIYTKHKWISKKKSGEKIVTQLEALRKVNVSWAQCCSSGSVSTSFCVGKWHWKMKSKGNQGFIFLPFSQWTNGQVTFRLDNYCLTFLIEVLTTRTLALSALNTFELWNRGRE